MSTRVRTPNAIVTLKSHRVNETRDLVSASRWIDDSISFPMLRSTFSMLIFWRAET